MFASSVCYLKVPWLVFFFSFIHLFDEMLKRLVYCNYVDGTDGKQARRTSTSGPLGELFDHGLDSWASLLMPVSVYSVFGRGNHSITPDRFIYILMGVMFTFVCSHWEKYNTGVLFLPWGYDISQLVSIHLFYLFICYKFFASVKYSTGLLFIPWGYVIPPALGETSPVKIGPVTLEI